MNEAASLQNNLSLIRGRHTFKTGYELLRTRINSHLEQRPSGTYLLGGTEFPFTPGTGNVFASFLMGGVVRADFTKALATWLPRWWSHALYFQDDWKVSPKLTLNLGIRWQTESPYQTKYGQQSRFDPTAIDPLTGLKGALLHPTGALAGRDINNFQPRVGVAYNFRKDWVFRGGFAINTLDLWTNGLRENFEEYLATAVIQQPTGNPSLAFKLSQGPPPVNFNVRPDGSAPFIGTNFAGRAASYFDPAMRSPYVMNWNAGIQRQLGRSYLLDINYQLHVLGKGNKQRTLPLPGEILDVLQSYLRLERPLTNSPYLFVSLKGRRRGQPITPAGLRSLFRHHRLRSQVAAANPHRFRHYATSQTMPRHSIPSAFCGALAQNHEA